MYDAEILAFEKLAELRAVEILEELEKEATTLGGAALGAATGATAGALSTKDKKKRLRRALIGGALGTAGGATTGHALGSLRQVKRLRQDIRGRGKDLYTRAKEVLETEGKAKKAEADYIEQLAQEFLEKEAAGFQRMHRLAKARRKGKDVDAALRGSEQKVLHRAFRASKNVQREKKMDAVLKKELGPNYQMGEKFTIPHVKLENLSPTDKARTVKATLKSKARSRAKYPRNRPLPG